MRLRKLTKNRGSFPSDEALLKLFFLPLRKISLKWSMPLPRLEGCIEPVYHRVRRTSLRYLISAPFTQNSGHARLWDSHLEGMAGDRLTLHLQLANQLLHVLNCVLQGLRNWCVPINEHICQRFVIPKRLAHCCSESFKYC